MMLRQVIEQNNPFQHGEIQPMGGSKREISNHCVGPHLLHPRILPLCLAICAGFLLCLDWLGKDTLYQHSEKFPKRGRNRAVESPFFFARP